MLFYAGSFSLHAANHSSFDYLYQQSENAVADSLSNDGYVKKSEFLSELKQYLDFDGYTKLRYEFDTYNWNQKFSVKNFRLGAKGKVTDFMSYRMQFEFSNGFKLLDLYASFKPVKGLEIRAGQGVIPFFNLASISPGLLYFSDYPLFVNNSPAGTRDIGLYLSYTCYAGSVPISFVAGYYLGCTLNEPQLSMAPNINGRIEVGSQDKGFRFAAKAMRNSPEMESGRVPFFSYGGELGYASRNFIINGEFTNHNNLSLHRDSYSNLMLQTAYIFHLDKSKAFKKILPAVKWDAVGDDVFFKEGFLKNRITAGLTFCFEYGKLASHLRFDYEHSLVSDKDSRLVMEVQIIF